MNFHDFHATLACSQTTKASKIVSENVFAPPGAFPNSWPNRSIAGFLDVTVYIHTAYMENRKKNPDREKKVPVWKVLFVPEFCIGDGPRAEI